MGRNIQLRDVMAALGLLAAGAFQGASAVTMTYSAFSDGSGSSSSLSYSNSSSAGPIIGTAEGIQFRSYGGSISCQTPTPTMNVIDNSIVFVDASPTASEVQASTNIDFKVTVQITGGNTLNDFTYQVSSWGVSGLATAPLLVNASTDTIITPDTKIRYHVTFPNSGGTVYLSASENNYIRCFARNNAGGTASAIFQIKVSSNSLSAVSILQPDTKSGIASIAPLIKASVNGSGVFDPATITVKVDDANGANIVTVSGATRPEIYNTSQRLVSYKYDGPALVSGATYKLTVSIPDGSASAVFKVKAGAIADLVPYPSPFDPKKQPVTIRYALNKNADVSINLYDRAGRMVWNVIDNQPRPAGISEETWNGGNYAGETLANGVYFCEIVVKDDEGEHRSHTAIVIFGK